MAGFGCLSPSQCQIHFHPSERTHNWGTPRNDSQTGSLIGGSESGTESERNALTAHCDKATEMELEQDARRR
jgi:hypothetical protein